MDGSKDEDPDRVADNPQHDEPGVGHPVGFGRILAYFLKLGAVGFGGPIATVGYMQRDLVEQRHWMDRQDFLELSRSWSPLARSTAATPPQGPCSPSSTASPQQSWQSSPWPRSNSSA